MDEQYLLAVARYIELNPVRAKLATDPRKYPWSSAAAHIEACDDALVVVAPLLKIVDDWTGFLAGGVSDESIKPCASMNERDDHWEIQVLLDDWRRSWPSG